ncbi:hypothetical protein LAZ40_11260 [Cereibacter sphaeroides]|uniref:hypothetical protein n=1 Tax=Cereibacter sphaeroides TaxID=1063 RepID=UPI001F43A468|nr:hypothetical protein [Cereibacter sphaeroides]MCE6959621.1 hypothetical protein [Cereibacter sphaeroides]MCE6974519.1 hypothetical protein [Cereibacter sphaeroides]
MRSGTDAHPSAFGVSEPTGAGEEPIDLDARRKQREAEKMEAARRKLLWELEEFGC